MVSFEHNPAPEPLSGDTILGCERARAVRTVRMADEWRPFGGGVACRREKGSWLNVMMGLGLGESPTKDEIASVLEWYRAVGRAPRAEVCDRAGAPLFTLLAESGFRTRQLIAVLARTIAPGAGQDTPAPRGVRIERLERTNTRACERLARVLSEAFATPEHPASEEDIATNSRALAHPESRAYVALAGDEPVGGGMMDVRDGVVALWGAAVKPEFRRRGVQGALLAVRLRDAATDGARLAFIEADPGGATYRNAVKRGFAPAYTRAILVAM